MSALPLPLHSRPARSSAAVNWRWLRFRLREKYLLVIGAFVLACICYSTFVFLPLDLEPRPMHLQPIKHQLQVALKQPEQLVLPRPIGEPSRMFGRHDDDGAVHVDPHLRADQEALRQKVDQAQIPAPDPALQRLVEQQLRHSASSAAAAAAAAAAPNNASARRDKVREMMKHAWDSYAKYAWGANELRPVSKTGHSASIFGNSRLGATIIDGLDTLFIMDLRERFDAGRKFVELSFNFDSVGDLSVFETNIRFVGGLLACYALTNDELFKNKAVMVADFLLPAFDTPTGIPYGLINVKTKSVKNWGWASGGSSILSEFGSLHLEFEYLSVITDNPIYAQKVHRIRQVLNSIEKPDGLYPNYLNQKTGKWGTRHVSMGALGDSFYEYLLKNWLVTNKRDDEAKRMYDGSIEAMKRQNMIATSRGGLKYFAELRGSRLDHKMDHLACFSAGMFALQAANEPEGDARQQATDLAKAIAHTCHQSYAQTETGIGPESFRFTNELEAKAVNEREKYYILRPEVIEGWFYLWRLTKDQRYRDWAWDAVLAIERHCKTDSGYSGIRNVYDAAPQKDDVQQSFFLAETLKYLFLIFSDDSVMPLERWVFNTEAHAVPVRADAAIDAVVERARRQVLSLSPAV